MLYKRNECRILKVTLLGKDSFGRPKNTSENNIQADLREKEVDETGSGSYNLI
jgi:hypothetical protein